MTWSDCTRTCLWLTVIFTYLSSELLIIGIAVLQAEQANFTSFLWPVHCVLFKPQALELRGVIWITGL